jgi:hypothetical protein
MEASTLLILMCMSFFYVCVLSFCSYQGFLVVLFEAMSLSIRYYTQISIARLNQLDIYLSSIHVPALSCWWRLLERRCFLL